MPRSYCSPEPILPARAVAVLTGLNRDYLDLAIAGHRSGVDLFGVGVMGSLSAATSPVLDSIAGCSYALFTLEPSLPLEAAPTPQIHDPVVERYGMGVGDTGAWTAFATAALSFAWHLSRNSLVAARVMLGFRVSMAAALAELDPWQLRYCAVQQPVPLQPRWADNPCFWPDLVRCAASENPLDLDLARLLGLQLLAADMQSAPAGTGRRRGS